MRTYEKGRARQQTLSGPAPRNSQTQYQPTVFECTHAEHGVP